MSIILVPLALYYDDGTLGFVGLVFFLTIFAIISLIPTLLLIQFGGEVADSVHKIYDEPIDKILPRLEGALTAKGVPFANRRGPRRTTRTIRIDEFLDLNQGQVTIALAPVDEATLVYLGPVVRENTVVIERLKALVDGAVG